MDLNKTAAMLHPLERKVLPHLLECSTGPELEAKSKLKDVEIIRALQWLENKEALKLEYATKEFVYLDKNGEEYAKKGLPERVFLSALEKPLSIPEAQQKTKLDKGEFNAVLGLLKKNSAITFQDGKLLLTATGKKLIISESIEEKFLKKLLSGPADLSTLNAEEKKAYEQLKKRKSILLNKTQKTATYTVTDFGKKLAKIKLDTGAVLDRLTPDLLKTQDWKGKNFRRYDVSAVVPRVSFGRRQHYRAFLDEVRRKFTTLGFKEMHGPIVETDFWDMDALFMPQFHSARDIHEAYYVKEPSHGKIDPKLLKNVKAAHENGFETGSKGWRYDFDEKRTARYLLRTQGTACSARMLANPKLEVPGKYFGIAKCFRYDVIDATHLPDFYQTEGIVVEEGLSFGHLKGLLKMFAEEFAKSDTVKIRPAYFPFTEPSAELFAKHPELGWIELGGAGVFRPELTAPLGVDKPVIAWGMGIDRIGMFNLGIKDIRDLYSQDLATLKKVRVNY